MGSYDTEPQLDTSESFGDWRDQLFTDGYAVIKGAISQDKAKHYLDSLFDWLETFPYGFKKDDPSTWGPQNLPAHIKYGFRQSLPPSPPSPCVHKTDKRSEAECIMVMQ